MSTKTKGFPTNIIFGGKNEKERKMKRSFKQIALIFLALALTVSSSMFLFACGKNGGSNTTNGTVPGIGSTSGTTGTSQTGATSGTTAGTTQGTTSTTATTTATPINPPDDKGDYINPLTGLKTEYSMGDTMKPLAIVVDNVPAAYAHQSGLGQADILYETLVAPGITRFMMLVSDYSKLDPICNIRSARLEHLDIVGSHNALMVAHNGSTYNDFVSVAASRLGGGWNETLGKNTFGYINTMKDVAFTDEGGEKYGTIKYYKDDPNYRKDLGWDTLVTSPAIMAVLQSRYSLFVQSGASSVGAAKGFDFAEDGVSKRGGSASAENIQIVFTMDNHTGKKNVSYVYDAELGMYRRSQDGKAHVESVTGKQLAFTNVITLFTDVSSEKGTAEDPVVATSVITGEGTGYYFSGGECVEIKWSKSAWDAELEFTDAQGNPLALSRGTTYIGYLDNTDIGAAVKFN